MRTRVRQLDACMSKKRRYVRLAAPFDRPFPRSGHRYGRGPGTRVARFFLCRMAFIGMARHSFPANLARDRRCRATPSCSVASTPAAHLRARPLASHAVIALVAGPMMDQCRPDLGRQHVDPRIIWRKPRWPPGTPAAVANRFWLHWCPSPRRAGAQCVSTFEFPLAPRCQGGVQTFGNIRGRQRQLMGPAR